ncbi:MAG: MFS transporter [Pseudomonadota bacterium]|nr:MFS transporter [Pseudomonadota bacterium]
MTTPERAAAETGRVRAPAREIFGWSMFDFANSSYTTVIITVVYATVFPKLIVGDERLGNLLWSATLSASYALVVLTAPLFGAIMDFSGSKKRFLMASWLLTVVATAALGIAGPGQVALAMVLLLISNFGFASGESFASSFLPDLGPPEALGRISGMAWGLGYFGGLLSTAAVLFGLGPATAENLDGVRLIGPVTAFFFFVGALPTFLLLRERGIPQPLPAGATYVSIGLARIRQSTRDVRAFRDLLVFLGSLFFSQAGLSIVIAFAFIYGDQVIRWAPQTMMMMFVITQLTAAVGAFLFGFIQDRIGARNAYGVTMVLWIVAAVLIYATPQLTVAINAALGTSVLAEHVFLGVGALAGTGLGAAQSSGRALVGLFAPPQKSGEIFGLWGVMGKLAAIFGLLGLGVLQSVLGLQTAILFCAVLFAAALVVVWFVDEARGREVARTWVDSPPVDTQAAEPA